MKKIVNEKGKLFGLINVVDLIVVLIVLLVVAAVMWKFVGSKVSNALSTKVEVTYLVKCEGLDAELKDKLEAEALPSQIMSSGSYVNSYLTKVETAPHTQTVCLPDGTVTTYEDPALIDAYFTCTAKLDSESITFPVGTQEVRTGKEHIVKTR